MLIRVYYARQSRSIIGTSHRDRSPWNMEDRHTISEPRIHDISQELTWEVDIYRDGVAQPIDTVIISDRVLPPRTNKKGKIVWKLPTEPGKMVITLHTSWP